MKGIYYQYFIRKNNANFSIKFYWQNRLISGSYCICTNTEFCSSKKAYVCSVKGKLLNRDITKHLVK